MLEITNCNKSLWMAFHIQPCQPHEAQAFMPERVTEIIWCYKERERVLSKWNQKHDVLLFYAKNIDCEHAFNWKEVAEPYSKVTLSKFKYQDEKGHYQIRGRNVKGSPIKAADGLRPEHEKKYPGLTYRDYLESRPGVPPRDWWEINIINKAAKERLGYPTQKPEALLERIIRCSCPEDGIVLDPFCGCGTTIAVAERLHRKWSGIDITHLAITLIKHRLQDSFGKEITNTYRVVGEPASLSGARELAKHDRFQFQWWALGLVGARPLEQKKGADMGIDGHLYFHEQIHGKTNQIIISVKSGHVGVRDIRDLAWVIEREKAEIGVLITLEEPTKPMKIESTKAGFYYSPHYNKNYLKIQILTIEDLFNGKTIDSPRIRQSNVIKKAKRISNLKQKKL